MSSVSTEFHSNNNKDKNSKQGFWIVLSSNVFLRSFVFSAILYFSIVLGGWPGQQVFPVLIISIIMGLLFAFVYGKIAGFSKSEKGLYFYLKSKIGKYGAFVTTLILFVFSNLTLGYLISFLPKIIVSDLSFIASRGYNDLILLEISNQVIKPQIIGVIGMFFVLATYISVSFSKYDFPKIFIYSIILLVLIGLVLILQIAFPIFPDFDQTRSAYFAEQGRQYLMENAHSLGINNFQNQGVYGFASLGIVMWFFLTGVEIVNLNQYIDRRKNVLANILSVLLISVFFVVLYFLVKNTVGFDWVQAQAFLNFENPAEIRSWITTIAGTFSPHPVYFGIIIVAQFIINFVILGISMISTGVFVKSWAEDGIFPQFVLSRNQINDRQSVPLLFSAIMIALGVLISALSTFNTDIVGFIFVMLVAQIPVLVSVLIKNEKKKTKKENIDESNLIIRSLAFVLIGVIVFSVVLGIITPVPNGLNPWVGVIIGIVVGAGGSLFYIIRTRKR